MKRACLLSGSPGAGKTTIIKQAVSSWRGSVGGFYTEEIRARGVRQGFMISTLGGRSAVLAGMEVRSPYRVSKYGVDIEALDEVGVSAVREATRECDLVVIDEIGKMELYSPAFKEAVLEALSSGKRILGTVMLGSDPWADGIKRHPDVALVPVTRDNRSQVLRHVVEWVKSPETSIG